MIPAAPAVPEVPGIPGTPEVDTEPLPLVVPLYRTLPPVPAEAPPIPEAFPVVPPLSVARILSRVVFVCFIRLSVAD